MKATIFFVLFSFVISLGIFAQENEYSFMEEYDLSSSGQFGLTLSDGFIQVYPSKENKVKVYYIVNKGSRFMKISKEELAEEVDLDITISLDRLDIKITNRHGNNWNNWKDQYNVSCEIYVPVSTSCYLKSSDGDITMQGIDGNQRCKTSDGNIRVTYINGDVDARTSDGDVHVEAIAGNVFLKSSDGTLHADEVDGNATFSTSDGDIKLYKVTGMIDASTSDGDIRFTDCAGSFSAVTSDGDASGNLVKLNGKLSVITSDGDIDVSIPGNIGINLKMKGEDLNVSRVELSGKINEHSIQGTVNGGGIPVELITSDGTVTLSYR